MVYGSKRGGTEGLAHMVGDALAEHGFEVTVRSAAEPAPDVVDYDVVVVGGAVYTMRWHRDARRFVRRYAEALRGRKVWLFSSGPIGDDAPPASEMKTVAHVRHAMEKVGALGHTTFGGRLEPDAKGFPASSMAKTQAGDWRDQEAVRLWVKEIVA